MCNTFAVYFQIFATFGYKKVKNSDKYSLIKNIDARIKNHNNLVNH